MEQIQFNFDNERKGVELPRRLDMSEKAVREREEQGYRGEEPSKFDDLENRVSALEKELRRIKYMVLDDGK